MHIRLIFNNLLLPILIVGAVISITVFQTRQDDDDLARTSIRGGRIVLSSGDISRTALLPGVIGTAPAALDSNRENPALLRHPSGHPEGTYLLMDLALSHWPSASEPLKRKPVSVTIYNGPCSNCTEQRFRSVSRIRRGRLEILYRRANNPDVEFLIPEARIVYSTEFTLPDSPDPVVIPIFPPLPDESPGYPEKMNYIIGKLIVLGIYPGEIERGIVAVGEVVYNDSPL